MLNKLNLLIFSKDALKNISEEPGIYLFFDEYKKPIYVGKAINLKSRLYSYSLKNLETKTSQMILNAVYFSRVLVSSEIEALILEAKLVSKFKPKYNIQLKDDKSPLYVQITSEDYPRVLTVRKPQLTKTKTLKVFGPFLTSESVFLILKKVRRIFPYATHKPEKKPCFYSHLGLCNPCPSRVETMSVKAKIIYKTKYKNNIRHIKKFLNGDVSLLTRSLTFDMQKYAENEDFEKASEIKLLIERVQNITKTIVPGEHFIENPNLREDIRSLELNTLQKVLKSHLLAKHLKTSLTRIECFDVAHLSGKYPVASMVTFVNGTPDKNFYRHFKIMQGKGSSDTDSMSEVGTRRIKHLADWGQPDLILVDGGKTQVSKMQSIFESHKILVVGIAKMSATLIIPIAKNGQSKYVYGKISLLNKKFSTLILRLKDEAHRFSRKLHHKLLKKSYDIAI